MAQKTEYEMVRERMFGGHRLLDESCWPDEKINGLLAQINASDKPVCSMQAETCNTKGLSTLSGFVVLDANQQKFTCFCGFHAKVFVAFNEVPFGRIDLVRNILAAERQRRDDKRERVRKEQERAEHERAERAKRNEQKIRSAIREMLAFQYGVAPDAVTDKNIDDQITELKEKGRFENLKKVVGWEEESSSLPQRPTAPAKKSAGKPQMTNSPRFTVVGGTNGQRKQA